MSGEGVMAARPAGLVVDLPPELRPHVVGKLGSDGQWRVLLMVPPGVSLFDGGMIGRELTVDEAEKLAWGLLDYAKLIRDKTGLPACDREA